MQCLKRLPETMRSRGRGQRSGLRPTGKRFNYAGSRLKPARRGNHRNLRFGLRFVIVLSRGGLRCWAHDISLYIGDTVLGLCFGRGPPPHATHHHRLASLQSAGRASVQVRVARRLRLKRSMSKFVSSTARSTLSTLADRLACGGLLLWCSAFFDSHPFRNPFLCARTRLPAGFVSSRFGSFSGSSFYRRHNLI